MGAQAGHRGGGAAGDPGDSALRLRPLGGHAGHRRGADAVHGARGVGSGAGLSHRAFAGSGAGHGAGAGLPVGTANIFAKEIQLSINGTTFIVSNGQEECTVSTPLIGTFNVYNVLAAYATGLALGLQQEQILTGIKNLKNVRGRFERITSPAGWTAIVDYAHTPDALENCLKTIHDVLPKENHGRIITVFGAGGDRDKTKRPIMGRIAGDYSDIVIVTSDNPRTEEPETIINDIMRGITRHANVLREVDRHTAIERAIKCAQRGDVVLIAGKGHEDYQIIGKEKTHFSDREVVENLL